MNDVDRYLDVFGKFCMNPLIPPGWDLSSAMLRQYWDNHGCVRCYMEVDNCLTAGDPKYDCELDTDKNGNVYLLNPQCLGNLTEALANWTDPGCRVTGRYVCTRHHQLLRCAAAVATVGPLDAGHMGFGYELPTQWRDWFKGGDITPNAWQVGEFAWIGRHWEMADGVPSVWVDVFDQYKLLVADNGNFEEAYLRSYEAMEQIYLTPVSNCQWAVHYVLTGFGAPGLPEEYYPLEATYFHWIAGDPIPIPSDIPPAAPLAPTPPRAGPKPTTPIRQRRMSASAAAKPHLSRAASTLKDAHERRHASLEAKLNRRLQSLETPQFARQSVRPQLLAVDTVYVVEPEDGSVTIHIHPECPALDAANWEPAVLGTPVTGDMRELARRFGGKVCRTCQSMWKADDQVVFACPSKDRRLEVFKRHLEIRSFDGSELLWWIARSHVDDLAPKGPVLGFGGPAIVVKYNFPSLTGERCPTKVELKFDSVEERDKAGRALEALLDPGV